MNYFPASLLLAGAALGACNSSPSNHQPITGNHPAPVDTPASRDTTAAASRAAVPFVNPTQVGRTFGSQSPSPPQSRTR